MDVVSDVLRAVRFSGLVIFQTELTAPWGLAVPPAATLAGVFGLGTRRLIPLHAVAKGRGVSVLDGVEALAEGDVVMYPHGDAHVLASDATVMPTPVGGLLPPLTPESLTVVRHGGGGALTRVVCGFIHCDEAVFNPLAVSLPKVLCGRGNGGAGATSLAGLLQLVLSEAATPRAGTTTILTRLTELMFVEVLRTYMEALPAEQTGWFAGLRDPFVGRALQRLHAEPARDWSVEELGRAVGLSRSALVDRFHALVGQPPMSYLTHWRIQLATRLLCDSHASVATIGEQVGYASEAAFSRAFRRVVGKPPAAWRREAALG
ncbi:MAG: AraC family transcriptional regulator [Deltaproteobacteria bacterium]|nr:AraC family transcriptional regulator [Deltaproteobacteria bacterium]